jgi:AraC-like DNA-binding protein
MNRPLILHPLARPSGHFPHADRRQWRLAAARAYLVEKAKGTKKGLLLVAHQAGMSERRLCESVVELRKREERKKDRAVRDDSVPVAA